MSTATASSARTLTTTEASILAVLALDGERSGYDLLRRMSTAIGYVWAPAKSQLYAVLPRLARDGLAQQRTVAQTTRPDKQLYRITDDGRAALDVLARDATSQGPLATPSSSGCSSAGSPRPTSSIRHVEAFREESQQRLDELRAIEPTNTRTGNDVYPLLPAAARYRASGAVRRVGGVGARPSSERRA